MNSSTRQIIDAAMTDSPLDIKNAIETVIGEKIASALEQKKVEVAKSIMGECSDFGGKHADKGKPTYHTKFSSGAGKKHEGLDMEAFKTFLSDELEVVLDNDDIEFLLEDMDQETFDEVMKDFAQFLTESKKN